MHSLSDWIFQCQKQDWHSGGHKNDCKDIQCHSEQAKNAGMGEKDVKKIEQYSENVSRAGAKAFYDNVHIAMLRPILEERSILDYVVTVDIREAPPAVGAVLASDILSENLNEDFPQLQSLYDRNRSNGNITCVCCSHNFYNENLGSAAILIKTFPGASVPNGSWIDHQKRVEEGLPLDLHEYKGDDVEAREEFLRDVTSYGIDFAMWQDYLN